MIWLTCSLDRAGRKPARFFYRLAGQLLASDTPLIELTAFATSPPFSPAEPTARSVAPSEPAMLTYEGPGLLGTLSRTFRCWASPSDYHLAIDGVGLFSISADGSEISLLQTSPNATGPLISEAALGPALVLALALRGTWSLHASAIVCDDRAVAFVGESGNGKSTLARFLGSQPGFGRLSDDLLPITLHSTGVFALPRFPQLKLAPTAQPSLSYPDSLPLACVYLLDPPCAALTAPRVEPLSSAHSTLALVRHTVASRLFAPDLLAYHLQACSTAAEKVSVRRLSLPLGLARLPDACEVLASDLSRLQTPPS